MARSKTGRVFPTGTTMAGGNTAKAAVAMGMKSAGAMPTVGRGSRSKTDKPQGGLRKA